MIWKYYFLLVLALPPYIESKVQKSIVNDKNKDARPPYIESKSKTQQSSIKNKIEAKDNYLPYARSTNGLLSIVNSAVVQPSNIESKTKVKPATVRNKNVDKETRPPQIESKLKVKPGSVRNTNVEKVARPAYIESKSKVKSVRNKILKKVDRPHNIQSKSKVRNKSRNKNLPKLARFPQTESKSKGQQSLIKYKNKAEVRRESKLKSQQPSVINQNVPKAQPSFKEPKVQQAFVKNKNVAKSPGVRRQVNNNLRIRNEYPFRLQGGKKKVVETVGGNVTNTENFPYMAAVIINGKLWCAGAIVDTNWVLTAAHCLNYVLHVSPLQTLSKYVKVRVGSSKAFEGGNLVDVVGAIRHPKYEQEPVPHADVALLKLAENLDFHKLVNLINIYDGTTEPYAQSFVEVSGWGVTKDSDTEYRDHARDMLTARLKIRPQQYCMDTYQLVDGFQFTDDFFCASLRNGTRDACLFDAGAPAVQSNQMMGIMSFGPEKCGHIFQPAVFIKAYYFRDFVEDTIERYRKPTKKVKDVHKFQEASEEAKRLDNSNEDGPLNIMLLSVEEEKNTD